MDKEKIKEAKKVCEFHLMRCTKKEIVDLFLEIMEERFPEKLIRISERAREEILF